MSTTESELINTLVYKKKKIKKKRKENRIKKKREKERKRKKHAPKKCNVQINLFFLFVPSKGLDRCGRRGALF